MVVASLDTISKLTAGGTCNFVHLPSPGNSQ